jgi:hypothetical protein
MTNIQTERKLCMSQKEQVAKIVFSPSSTALVGPLLDEVFLITFRHTTIDRTPLDEGSTRRRDLYLITHNTHKR